MKFNKSIDSTIDIFLILYVSNLIYSRINFIMNIKSDEYKNILLVSTWSQIYNVSLVFTLLSIFLIKILKKDDGNYSFHKLVLLLLLYLLQKFDIGNAEDYINNLFIKRNFSNRYPEFKLLLDIYILSKKTKNSNEKINVLCGKNKGSLCGKSAYETSDGIYCAKHHKANKTKTSAQSNCQDDAKILEISKKMTVAKLREYMRKHSLRVGGNKRELIVRYINNM